MNGPLGPPTWPPEVGPTGGHLHYLISRASNLQGGVQGPVL